MDKTSRIKLCVAIGLLGVAGLIWYLSSGGAADAGAKVYFYDENAQRLYAAPRASFAPIGDGVEALVVRCPQCGASQQRIAYLRSHTPEYKQKHEDSIRSTHGVIEGMTREYAADNTLVRRVEEPTWHVSSSKEGTKIVSSWKRRCPTHGDSEQPVLPGQ